MEDQVRIEQLNRRGWGVGFRGALAEPVEVIGALPGDLVSICLHKKKRGQWRAGLLKVIQPSSLRVESRCGHVPTCGGCTWQQMAYSAQLAEKENRVKKIFSPFMQKIQPIIPCEDPWHYRNKMEFSFSQNQVGKRFLGLMIAGSKGHVLPLSECHLVSPWFISVLKQVHGWWEQSGLLAYRRNDSGTLRTLTLREGKRTKDKLVMLTVSGHPAYAPHQGQLKSFIEAVHSSVPHEDHARLSLFLRIQQIHKGSPTQFYEMHLAGPDHLLEKMSFCLDRPIELTFKISPTAFFQPNPLQAEKLYAAALQMVSFPKRCVFDLYAGTATLSMIIAPFAEKVTAIELNPYACLDAQANKEFNQLNNLEIICGDVGKTVEVLRKRSDFVPPDLVVIDPPRMGLDETALSHLMGLGSKEILYISCNPETQILNIQRFMQKGYALVHVQPVDQFPHTPHIENIALLKLKC